MKQSLQQKKRPQPTTVPKTQSAAPRLRPRLPRQTNHPRMGADKWERQADDVAGRLLKGDNNVLRLLSPAPTAGKKLLGSGGEPLPQPLREDLESRFDADFTAIRIHRDSLAHAAVEQAGAKAFTSGRDIFFSRSSYNPDRMEGKTVLYHELAHTLQQTGRPGGDGRIRVTDAMGKGSVQFITIDPDNPPLEADLDGDDPNLKIAYIVYLRVGADVEKLETVNTWLDPLIASLQELPPTPANIAHAQAILRNAGAETAVSGRQDYENEILYDFLKLMSSFDTAADFLSRHRFLRTAFYSPAVVNELYRQKGSEWVAAAMAETWLANRLWDDAYRQALTRYLRTPTENVPIDRRLEIVEGRNGISSQNLARRIQGRINTRSRPELNEWATEGAQLVVQADILIRRLVREIEQDLDAVEEPLSQFERRRRAAYAMSQLELQAPESGEPAEGEDSVEGPSQNVQTVMREVGAQNYAFYENLLSREQARLSRYTQAGETRARQQDEARQYWQHRPFQNYARPLFLNVISRASGQLALQPHAEGDLVESYRPLQEQARELADHIDQTLIGPTLSRALSESQRAQPDQTLVDALYWFASMGELLHQLLVRILSENPADAGNFLDVAISHRYALMKYLINLAGLWEMESQARVFAPLLAGRDVRKSQLALPNDPEADRSVNVSRFQTDFGHRHLYPFSAGDLVRFMRWDHENRLLANIRSQIRARRNPVVQANTGLDDLFLLGRAERMTEAREAYRPTRYRFTDTVFIYYPDDAPTVYGRLVEEHHRMRSLVSRSGESTSLIWPETKLRFAGEQPDTLIVWLVPNLSHLVGWLKRIRILNALVYLHRHRPQLFTETRQRDEQGNIVREAGAAVIERAAAVTDDQIGQARRLDDWQWYEYLDTLGNGSQILTRYGAEAVRTLTRQFTGVRQQLPGNLRAATTLDRQVLTRRSSEDSISGLLQRYTGRADTYHLIRRAFEFIDIFEANIRPQGDRSLQMAALVLELAPDFHGAIINEDLASVNSRAYPLFSEAMAQAVAPGGASGTPPLLLESSRGILPESEASRTWINSRVDLLRETMQAQTARLRDLQENLRVFGFRSPESGKLESQLHGSPIIAGEIPEAEAGGEQAETDVTGPFVLDGLRYEIIQVHTDFTIFLHTGERSGNPEIQRHLLHVPGVVAAGSDVAHARDAVPLDATTPLITYRVALADAAEGAAQPGRTRVIHAGDTQQVKDFAFLIHRQSNMIGLQNLATAIEYFGEGMMLAASLTPYGWAVDVVMLLQMISEAMNDEGFIAELRAFTEEPLSILDDLKERFTEALTVDRLLELLLFGFPHYNLVIGGGEERRRRRPRLRRSGRRGRLGARILDSMRRLGRTLAYQLHRIEQNVQQPVGSLQAFVLSRAILRRIFSWAARHYYVMAGMAAAELRGDSVMGRLMADFEASRNPSGSAEAAEQSLPDFIWGGFDARIAELRRQVNDIINAIEGFELPETVFPTEEAAVILGQAFVNFLTRRPRGRVGLLLRALNEGGRATGVNALLLRKMNQLLIRNTEMDPNVYWREAIIPEIGGHMEQAAHDLAQSLQHLLTHTPIIKEVFSGELARPSVTVTASGQAERAENIAEAETFLAEIEAEGAAGEQGEAAAETAEAPGGGSAQPSIMPGTVPKLGMPIQAGFPGKSLPKSVHQAMAVRFGQDFAHVRVNQFSPLARQLGVKAFTTGSRIHFSGGLARDAASQRTLTHELVHVIQQTGSRPLGGRYDSGSRGASGSRGLYYSPKHEQEAQRAESSYGHRSERFPVTRGAGMAMPAVQDAVVETLLTRLVSDTDLRSDVATIAERAARRRVPARFLPDQPALRTKAQRWCDQVLDIIHNERQTLGKAAFLRDTRTQFQGNRNVFESVKQHLSRNRSRIRRAARLMAFESLKQYRTGRRRNGQPVLNTDIDATAFFRLLEGYLLLEMGVGLNISANVAQRNGVVRATVSRVRMNHLYLPKLAPSRLGFWRAISENSFGPEIPAATAGEARSRELARWQRRAAGILHGQPFLNPFVSTPQYKFDADFVNNVRRALTGSESIETSEWPDWQTYLKKDRQGSGPQIGLRIGTYDQAGAGGLQNGPNRESHHVIQYLMIKYFGQAYRERDHMPQPFPDRFNFPSRYFTTSGGESTNRIRSVGDVDVASLNEGQRGGPMPAILLSARAHHRNNLHITAEGEERADGTVSTNRRQAYAVDRIYRNHLRNRLHNEQLADLIRAPGEAANRTTFNNLMRNSSQQNDMGTAAPAAMKLTYRDIRRHMLQGLQQALENEEKDYYAGFVRNDDAFKRNGELKPEFDPDQIRPPGRRLANVYNDARNASDRIFRQKGWE